MMRNAFVGLLLVCICCSWAHAGLSKKAAKFFQANKPPQKAMVRPPHVPGLQTLRRQGQNSEAAMEGMDSPDEEPQPLWLYEGRPPHLCSNYSQVEQAVIWRATAPLIEVIGGEADEDLRRTGYVTESMRGRVLVRGSLPAPAVNRGMEVLVGGGQPAAKPIPGGQRPQAVGLKDPEEWGPLLLVCALGMGALWMILATSPSTASCVRPSIPFKVLGRPFLKSPPRSGTSNQA
jgi:hypothetical protein